MDINLEKIVKEYVRLSKLDNPTEIDLAKIHAILELTCIDRELLKAIDEADHQIAEELSLC